MSKREKLLRQATNNPAGIRFAEACYLAEAYGWQFYHQVGSHRQYRRPGFARSINLQEAKDGMSKPEQVKELLKRISELEPNYTTGGGPDDAE